MGLTCSSSRLCSFSRASIFPMISCCRLRSSSMSRCCWPSRSCSAGGNPQGAQQLLPFPPGAWVAERGGRTPQLLVMLPDPQLPLLGGGEV